ncbi:MAG: hypothetical protein V4681_03700 [Patescibacteria group bacterium]
MDLVPPRPVSAPVAPPQKQKRPIALLVLGILAIALIAGAIFFYPPLRNSVQQAWSDFFYPEELAKIRFIANQNGTSALYARAGSEFVPYTITDGALPSETFASFTEDGAFASILLFPDGFTVLAIDGAQVHSSVSEKTTVDLSPNKKLLAFTERTSPSAELQAVVINPENKNQTLLGTGFSPFFLDDARVLWFSSEGVMLTELASSSVSILEKTSARAQPSPVLSPRGNHIAWMDSDGSLQLRRLEGSTLVQVATYLDVPSDVRLGLGDAGLYTLSASDGGTNVRRYPLEQGESKRIYTFETEWNILQLIP